MSLTLPGSGALTLPSGTLLAARPAQFDNSSQLVDSGFVRAAGEAFGGIKSVNAAATLDATYAGKLTILSGSSYTATLPAASSYPGGATVTFESIASGVVTIARAGADNIVAANGFQSLASMPVGNGDTLTLVSDGVSNWYAQAGTAQLGYSAAFGQNLGVNGYQKLPGGMILQWGSVTATNANTDYTFTFPIVFPTACRSVTATGAQGSALPNAGISGGPSASSVTVRCSLAASTIYIMAIGL